MVTVHLPFQRFYHHSNNSFRSNLLPCSHYRNLVRTTHSNLSCAESARHFLMTHSDLAFSLCNRPAGTSCSNPFRSGLFHCSAFWSSWNDSTDWTCTSVAHYSPHVLTHSDLASSLARHSLPPHRNHEIHNWCEIRIVLDRNSTSWPQPVVVFPR